MDTHTHTYMLQLTVRGFRPNTQTHFIRASQRRVWDMFQVVISIMFSTTGKMGQFGPDSTIRRWIPELSSGLSTHKLERAW